MFFYVWLCRSFAWKFVYFVFSSDVILNTNIYSTIARADLEIALDFRRAGTPSVRQQIIHPSPLPQSPSNSHFYLHYTCNSVTLNAKFWLQDYVDLLLPLDVVMTSLRVEELFSVFISCPVAMDDAEAAILNAWNADPQTTEVEIVAVDRYVMMNG